MNANPFLPGVTNAIAATIVSQARLLPSAPSEINAVFYNDGPNVAFVATGAVGLVAVLPVLNTNIGAAGNCTPIPVGASINLSFMAIEDSANPSDYWAVICPIGTAAVYCTSGIGV